MKIVYFLIIIFSLTSCVYNQTAEIEDLGNGYFYLGDGNESQILYNENRKENDSDGRIVTGPEVIEYNYNAKYIIIKSLKNKQEVFWIIDKNLPIDSIKCMSKKEFTKEIKKKEIKLELKERK